MAVLALTSASGAPGVTTTALAMTLLWPRPVVLLEADVTGGSAVLAGYLRGAVSAHERSLLGLAAAHRAGRLGSALFTQALPLDEEGQKHLIPAIADPTQAPALDELWEPLGGLLALYDTSGIDVIVDAGRLGAAHGPDPLLTAADAVLLATRTQLPAVAATRSRAGQLRARREQDGVDPGGPNGLGLLLVGDGRPYTRRDITAAVGLPVTATLAWDPGAAEVLAFGAPRPRRWEQSELITSAGTAVAAAQALLRQARDRVGAPGEVDHTTTAFTVPATGASGGRP